MLAQCLDRDPEQRPGADALLLRRHLPARPRPIGDGAAISAPASSPAARLSTPAQPTATGRPSPTPSAAARRPTVTGPTPPAAFTGAWTGTLLQLAEADQVNLSERITVDPGRRCAPAAQLTALHGANPDTGRPELVVLWQDAANPDNFATGLLHRTS